MDCPPRSEKRTCPVCSKRILNGVAYIEFSPVLGDPLDRTFGRTRKRIEQLVQAAWHVGHERTGSDVADTVDLELRTPEHIWEFAVPFCSLACLRRWFCDMVDQLGRVRQATGLVSRGDSPAGRRSTKQKGGVRRH